MSNKASTLVGITGGIGSGKSTVAKIFSILGIPIYSADDRAKWLMGNDELLKTQIKDSFGDKAYQADGSIGSCPNLRIRQQPIIGLCNQCEFTIKSTHLPNLDARPFPFGGTSESDHKPATSRRAEKRISGFCH